MAASCHLLPPARFRCRAVDHDDDHDGSVAAGAHLQPKRYQLAFLIDISLHVYRFVFLAVSIWFFTQEF